MSGNGHMTRGEVARRAGVGPEAIRFYEREGLLPEPPRTPAGYRQYDDGAVARLRFIQRAKELGFSLSDVRDLISLRLDPEADCDDVKRRAEEKLVEIRGKIRDLSRMEVGLERLTEACEANAEKMECPLLQALEPDEVE
jgi:Hg(II)-responsive transcriptional regulator